MIREIVDGYRIANFVAKEFERLDKKGVRDFALCREDPNNELFEVGVKMNDSYEEMDRSTFRKIGVLLYELSHPIRTYCMPKLADRVLGEQ